MRVAVWEVKADGRRAPGALSHLLKRPPPGYDADEPVPGDPRNLIVGNWEHNLSSA